jgi:hypothetical protein
MKTCVKPLGIFRLVANKKTSTLIDLSASTDTPLHLLIYQADLLFSLIDLITTITIESK